VSPADRDDHADPVDPVVARRARIGRAARAAKRAGYLALSIAIVAFGVGVVTEFSRGVVQIVVIGLVATCVILPIPIVVAYGVGAAERDERGVPPTPPPGHGPPRGQAE